MNDSLCDYLTYRGKCREFAEAEAAKDPDLRVVRGWYYCSSWGRQEHWWCEDQHNNIIDPTKDQFPSKGAGLYREYDGMLNCEYCGKQMAESDVYAVDQHIYCSYQCYGRDVMG